MRKRKESGAAPYASLLILNNASFTTPNSRCTEILLLLCCTQSLQLGASGPSVPSRVANK